MSSTKMWPSNYDFAELGMLIYTKSRSNKEKIEMKKHVYVLLVMMLCAGCMEHKFHTYYGDIDTDTINDIIKNKDDGNFYLVKVDSAHATYRDNDSLIPYTSRFRIYYNPKHDYYVKKYITGDWEPIVYYDPYLQDSINNAQ